LLATDFVVEIWAPDESRLLGGCGYHLWWGFEEWPWVRLSWRCSSSNLASQRVAEKAGLQREGILRSHALDPDGSRRDTVCYAVLRDEWRQRNAAPRA
jgi:hypothetical protein